VEISRVNVPKPFTLPAPHWKLAVHARLLGRSPHAGRWLKDKKVNGSCAE
jgi:hypothetical protein